MLGESRKCLEIHTPSFETASEKPCSILNRAQSLSRGATGQVKMRDVICHASKKQWGKLQRRIDLEDVTEAGFEVGLPLPEHDHKVDQNCTAVNVEEDEQTSKI